MNLGFSINILNQKCIINSYLEPGYDNLRTTDEEMDVLIEGLILNRNKLQAQYGISDFSVLIKKLISIKGEYFVQELEGEFRGFYLNKKKNEISVFTNPTATHRFFYGTFSEGIFVDTKLVRLSKTLRDQNISLTPNLEGLYQLLSFENMLEDHSPIQNVFKILDGHFIKINITEKKLENIPYFSINQIQNYSGTKNQALDGLHEVFQNAVKEEYEKDFDYGNNHFSLLSGGLDSRISLFYALKNGFKNVDTFCFSQKNYIDEVVSKKIARDRNLNYHFVALNPGDFLKNIDHLTLISDGTNLFTGAIHVQHAFDQVNLEKPKIIHSGQIGGANLGTYIGSKENLKPRIERITLNHTFIPYLTEETMNIFKNYENEELFLLRNIGYNRTVIGGQVINQYAHQVSAFMHTEFLKFVINLPNSWRYKNNFYLEWINKHCPDVQNYLWERTNMKPNAQWKTDFGIKVIRRAKNIMYGRIMNRQDKTDMCPYQYYYNTNTSVQKCYQDYYENNLNRLDHYPELKRQIELLFQSRKFLHKTQAINILSIFKCYFG